MHLFPARFNDFNFEVQKIIMLV